MYFNGKTLTAILSDAATETKAAPAIAAARRRFTSSVAVVDAVLAAGRGSGGGAISRPGTARAGRGHPWQVAGGAVRCHTADAMSQVKAPLGGLVAYHRQLGDSLRAGEMVATIIDPLGDSLEMTAETEGILFARHSQPFAWPGKVIGKIAGTSELAHRQGLLLTD